MYSLLSILAIFVQLSFAQDEVGNCECGLFARIEESGLLPPSSRVIGPLYTLPNTEEIKAPCTGNVEAVCAQYCDLRISEWIAEGNDLDVEVEIETAPGVFENETIGQIMCTRSYQLHPNPGDYDGTVAQGAATRMHIQLNPCENNWLYRGCYADLVLCCDADYQYGECTGEDPVVCE